MKNVAALIFVLLWGLFGVAFTRAAETAAASAPPRQAPVSELRVNEAIILGVIEGLTEFLPVSSTGHLLIATRELGLDSNQPMFDSDGEPLWYNKAAGQLLTLRLAAATYIIVIQFGAIAAVALLYWQQLMSMWRGLFGRDPAGLRLLITIVIAFLPAAFLGLLIHDWVDENFFSVETVIVTQVAGALLMFYAEYWYARRYISGMLTENKELSYLGAAGIGVLQCAALIPGVSRPMMTIVGGYFAGLDPHRSAEFSFLLGFFTLIAASIFKSYKSGPAMIEVFGWSHVLLGAAVAAVTAAICIRLMVTLIMRHGLSVFAWYRLALAAVLTYEYLR